MTSGADDPTVVLVPIWGVGHFVPMIEAGKRLLARSRRPLTLTVLIMPAPSEKRAAEIADHVRELEAESAALGLPIRFLHLPAAAPRPAGAAYSGPEEFLSLNVQPYVAHVTAAMAGLACPVAALVVDLFCTPLLDAAHGLGVPAYVYLITSAAMCALLLRSPALDEEATAMAGAGVQFEEVASGEVHVPGLPPVPASCLPSGLVDRNVPTYRWFLYNGRRYTETAGIIVNTVAELEPRVLAAIADGRCTAGTSRAPTVYTIGPVLAATIAAATTPPPEQQQQEEERHECVRWLDAQPPASVLFLCFGSARFLAARQAHEAAHALDRSGHRFLWVLRGPPEAGTKLSTDGDLAELLPPGFSERTRGRGLVWPRWAPQKEILAHAAVGGFVSHCGWNSTLESLWFGVPVLPWPGAAEQHYNAFTLVAAMGVAVTMEVRRKEDTFVEAAELERAVRALMRGAEGATAREKAREMKAACRRAVEEGGSSYASLQRLCDALHQGAVLPSSGK